MKQITRLLLYLTLVLWSCDEPGSPIVAKNQANGSEPQKGADELNHYLQKFEPPSQTFDVGSLKPIQVKGEKGTVISVNPSDLETLDGKQVGNTIRIELKELTDQQELLCNNAQTVSNGQLLVSGGAYFVNMTSNGQQLKLKDGKSLAITFPKVSENEMELFYGQRDSLGQMNWKKANVTLTAREQEAPQKKVVTKKVKNRSDIDAILEYVETGDTTTTQEEREEKAQREKNFKVEQKLYDAINIRQFGWINVDRFLKIPNRTDLLVKLNPLDSIINANVYLVYKDINSVQHQYYYKGMAADNSVKFEGLPLGYKIRLITYTVKNEKAYAFAADITTGKKQKIDAAFKSVSEKEFKNMLGH